VSAQGANLFKYNRYGFKAKKFIRITTNGTVDWGSGSLVLRDALEIKGARFGNADPRFCLSIVMPTRSLNLEASSEKERDFWLKGLRELKSRCDSISDETDDDNRKVKTVALRESDILDFKKSATIGRVFYKYGRLGSPHQRIVRVTMNTGLVDYESGSLSLKDAIDIRSGKETKVLKKKKKADADLCFSIVLPKRELNLQASSTQERDVWVNGLKELRAKLEQMMPQKPSTNSFVIRKK